MTFRFTDEQLTAYNTALARKRSSVGNVEIVRGLPDPLERDVLATVLAALKLHPKVAWVQRMNVVAQKIEDRFVRAGFPGMSDITGQLRDGRRLEVEVKRRTTQPTQAQVEFLGLVNRSGGLAFIACDVSDVTAALGDWRAA